MVVQSLNLTISGSLEFVDTGMVLEDGQRLHVLAKGSLFHYFSANSPMYGISYPEGVYELGYPNTVPPYDPNNTLEFADVPHWDSKKTGYISDDTKPYSLIVWIGNTPSYPLTNAFQLTRDETIFEHQHSGGKVWIGINKYRNAYTRTKDQINVTVERFQPDIGGPENPIQIGNVSPIRFIPPTLLSEKNKKSQATAWFWFIQPANGPAEAYTNWDVALNCPAYENEFGLVGNLTPAMTYMPHQGVDLTELPQSIKLGIKAPDVRVLRLDRERLLKGYYDGAQIEVFENVVEGDRSQRNLALVGELGNTEVEDGGVATIELTPIEEIANRPIGGKILPICDVGRLPGETFGRVRCYNLVKQDGINIEDLTRGGTITIVSSTAKFRFTSTTISGYPGYENGFKGSHGRVIGVTGKNSQVIRDIGTFDSSNGDTILRRSLPFVPELGDTFLIEAGCDKTGAMCRFWNNLHNFRGFENVPGRAAVRRRWGLQR